MNKAIIIGRLTKDIDLKYTTDGQMAVSRFTVAVPRGKDKNGNDKGADFISCVAFGRRAETLERFVRKGHRIAVSGQIRTGSYEANGEKKYTTDVIVQDFDFLQPKEKSEPPVESYYTDLTDEEIEY